MGWLSDFFGKQNGDGESVPSPEDLEGAQAADRLMNSEYENEWNDGIDMGTIPETPYGDNDAQDTDKHSNSLIRKIFGW